MSELLRQYERWECLGDGYPEAWHRSMRGDPTIKALIREEARHSAWFRPFAAAFYAWKYLGEDLGREETLNRLPALLALEHRFTQESLLEQEA